MSVSEYSCVADWLIIIYLVFPSAVLAQASAAVVNANMPRSTLVCYLCFELLVALLSLRANHRNLQLFR